MDIDIVIADDGATEIYLLTEEGKAEKRRDAKLVTVTNLPEQVKPLP
jgi:hypothetical protein